MARGAARFLVCHSRMALPSMSVAAVPIARRTALWAGTLAFLTLDAAPALAQSEGAWAKHSGPFSDDDFLGMQTTTSGLMYRVVEEGYGVKPQQGQKIKAHYAGFLLDGKKFDASYDRGSPLKFAAGVGQVIKGWDEALLDMKVGEKRLLKIPANLAYGARGAGGVIPPDATLVFFVELVTLAV
uniref:peptidylprolyl isomerase n=1 Tax=Coccolithus braarudii TaxID=221442 RepID=A0A7S0LTH2_9EUKA